jgi:hypothetical protein
MPVVSFRSPQLRALAAILLDVERHETDHAQRYRLLLRALPIANSGGVDVGVRCSPADPDRAVVYFELPGVGQVAWHVPAHVKAWDGHTKLEKSVRVRRFATAQGVR